MSDENTAEVIEETEIVEAEAETTEDLEVTEGEGGEETEAIDAESSTEETETDEPKKKDGFQKRVDELTRSIYEAKQEADYWKEQAGKPPEDKKPFTPGKTLADFDYDEEEFTSYIAEQAREAATQEITDKARTQQGIKRQASFEHKAADFAKEHADFNQVARRHDLPINEYMANTIQQSDIGPQLLYHLGKNPEVAAEMYRMHPLLMAKELGKLEIKLSEVKKSVTKTPAPVPKIDVTNDKVKKSPEKMSMKEFEAHRRKIIARR